MKAKFIAEAKKHQVFPMDASVAARIVAPRPNITAGRTEFVYTRPMVGLPQGDSPFILNSSYTITADIERVAMPVGDIVATTVEFQDPKKPQERQVGGYFFIANGVAVASSYGVRQAAFNLRDRYAYYCKIQLTNRGKVSDPNGSLIGPFRRDAADLLSGLLPHVMRCLPDWPGIEAEAELARADARDGSKETEAE
jgi:hypothetical protein